jgi:hypothetical protein
MIYDMIYDIYDMISIYLLLKVTSWDIRSTRIELANKQVRRIANVLN